jgi:hypothetical protein
MLKLVRDTIVASVGTVHTTDVAFVGKVLIEYLYILFGHADKVVVEIAPGNEGCVLDTVNKRSELLPHELLLLTFMLPPIKSPPNFTKIAVSLIPNPAG